MQRPDKARIFGELRQIVENLKAGNMSTAEMTVIRPDQIAQTSDPFATSSPLSFAQPIKVEAISEGTEREKT